MRSLAKVVITRNVDADGLEVKMWTYQVWAEEYGPPRSTFQPVLRLFQFEHARRESKRHRKFEPILRLRHARSYEGTKAVDGWKDLTGNVYAWDTGDCRSAKPGERPEHPADVAREALDAVRPSVEMPI